jgi:hypothetical protein
MTPIVLFVFFAASAALPATAAEWPALKVGAQAVWDAQTDAATQTRFIPLQLIVPGVWDGTQRIDLRDGPQARDYEAEETVWNGPQEWINPYSGETLMVYDRRRNTRREGPVEQKMALRADATAIGRVYDSRFGASVCAQAAKFPLGLWKQGEARSYDYVCLRTVDGRVLNLHRRARISIEEIDYEYRGIAHSLRFAWHYTDSDSGEVLDHRTYIFAPGLGLVVHDRRWK